MQSLLPSYEITTAELVGVNPAAYRTETAKQPFEPDAMLLYYAARAGDKVYLAIGPGPSHEDIRSMFSERIGGYFEIVNEGWISVFHRWWSPNGNGNGITELMFQPKNSIRRDLVRPEPLAGIVEKIFDRRQFICSVDHHRIQLREL